MTNIDLKKKCDKKQAQTLSHEELNEIWVPDRHLWRDMDKEELALRKQEWKCIQRSLKSYGTTEFRGSYLKAHKDLYFKGVVSANGVSPNCIQGSGIFSSCYTLFYLWYYPNLTHEKCQEIIEYFSQSYFVSKGAYDLLRTRSQLFFRVKLGNYSANGEYGFMGERMGVIAPHLLGEKGEDTSFEKVSESKQITAGGIVEVMSGSLACLVNPYPNPYLYWPGRYIWRQASYHLETFLAQYSLICEEIKTCPPAEQHINENKLRSWNVSAQYLISSLEALVYFNNHPKVQKDHPKVVLCRNEILAQYENGEFAEPMNALFELVKANGLGNTTSEQVRALI